MNKRQSRSDSLLLCRHLGPYPLMVSVMNTANETAVRLESRDLPVKSYVDFDRDRPWGNPSHRNPNVFNIYA